MKIMKTCNSLIIVCAGLLMMAASAKADVLETWQLTGTVTSGINGFTPTTYFDIGDTVTIDYTFDLSTPFETEDQPEAYVSTVSMTFEGQVLSSAPVLAWGGSANLNENPGIDGVALISFGFSDATPVPNVLTALDDIESGVSAGQDSLRLDFNVLASPGSALVTVTSFAPVPEPGGIGVFATGLVALILSAKQFGGRKSLRRWSACVSDRGRLDR